MPAARDVRRRRLGLTAMLAMAIALVAHPFPSGASSHRDAPLISKDPQADNTDLYAFVSTEAGRSGFVTLIANYIPFEDPKEGPSYYRFSDVVLYEIMVDVNGDGQEDLTYQFLFRTTAVNGNRQVYTAGRIGLPRQPSDPASPYANLNLRQHYTLAEVQGDRRTGKGTILLEDARVAPIHVGPRFTGTPAEYEALVDAAIHTIPDTNGTRVFAGPRAEGFYFDFTGALNPTRVRNPGVNSTKGLNVHSIALEIPKARLLGAGSNGVIGVWASASRAKSTVIREKGQRPRAAAQWVQVSRLGNPLVSSALIPGQARDRYNATEPKGDGPNFKEMIVNPGAARGPAALIPTLRSLTRCTATVGRTDVQAAFLTGIQAGMVPGFPGNVGGETVADMLRLNFLVTPSGRPNRLGLLGGDIFGFPNGRRVGDDVVDIVLRIAGGELQPLVGLPACAAAAALGDNVNGPDVPYLPRFPYLATPYQGSDLTRAR